jgi:predicted nuclease of restriction endonuclease-like (RecB) superfamily
MKKNPRKSIRPVSDATYDDLCSGVISLLEYARRTASRAVNHVMTVTYWEIGRRIVEHEQQGSERAKYGERLLEQLAKDLTERLGRGFARTNLSQMRLFFLTHREIIQTPSELFDLSGKIQTVSEQSLVGQLFPLSWSHYVRLLSVKSDQARQFYEEEALRGGWSVRQLDRQIATLFYERARKSAKKLSSKAHADDALSAQEEIRDPFVLEFLDLKDEYSEGDLEQALILHLEHFLLELGNDFTFVARQKRLRVGNEWYRIDLLFFHRRLRALVLIDLKLGKFTHADAGQMNLYLNYARERWRYDGENEPVGLILCSERNEAVAHYALGQLSNTILARKYELELPSEEQLADELTQTRRALLLRARATNESDEQVP